MWKTLTLWGQMRLFFGPSGTQLCVSPRLDSLLYTLYNKAVSVFSKLCEQLFLQTTESEEKSWVIQTSFYTHLASRTNNKQRQLAIGMECSGWTLIEWKVEGILASVEGAAIGSQR